VICKPKTLLNLSSASVSSGFYPVVVSRRSCRWIPDNVSVSLVTVPPVGQPQASGPLCSNYASITLENRQRLPLSTLRQSKRSSREPWTSYVVRLDTLFSCLRRLPVRRHVQTSCFPPLVSKCPTKPSIIDQNRKRYTGEGMDPMEFSEAESNVHDLM
jgi:hypothetical protein